MATQAKHISASDAVAPVSAKRFWQNPRWLLLLPVVAVVGTSAFLIVRRRKSNAAQ
ncbi:MAG: hypothetical protein WCD86_19375 [Ktedonobacteraceae bacterium]